MHSHKSLRVTLTSVCQQPANGHSYNFSFRGFNANVSTKICKLVSRIIYFSTAINIRLFSLSSPIALCNSFFTNFSLLNTRSHPALLTGIVSNIQANSKTTLYVSCILCVNICRTKLPRDLMCFTDWSLRSRPYWSTHRSLSN